jgi:DNA-binding CsgD family transcriptional regulator
MTVLPQEAATSVLVVGDAQVRSAIARLLSFESGVIVAGTAPTIQHAIGIHADVVIDEALLDQLKGCTIADFLAIVKSMPPSEPLPARHLRPLANDRDMRAFLSDRELQVVKLVAEGLSNRQISLRLKLSDKTVKNHISHILAKLNLSARTQVAVHALRTGLV